MRSIIRYISHALAGLRSHPGAAIALSSGISVVVAAGSLYMFTFAGRSLLPVPVSGDMPVPPRTVSVPVSPRPPAPPAQPAGEPPVTGPAVTGTLPALSGAPAQAPATEAESAVAGASVEPEKNNDKDGRSGGSSSRASVSRSDSGKSGDDGDRGHDYHKHDDD